MTYRVKHRENSLGICEEDKLKLRELVITKQNNENITHTELVEKDDKNNKKIDFMNYGCKELAVFI
jgi:hypothetical protein